MDNRTNRWVTSLVLLAMFGVIAIAGGRATRAQGTQNVLVTNTSSQQVPVLPPARPGPGGAYIVSVANAPNVKVLSSPNTPVSTKEVNGIDPTAQLAYGVLTITAGTNGVYSGYFILSPTNPSIVEGINVSTNAATAAETGDLASLRVVKAGLNQADWAFPLQPTPHGNYTMGSASTRIPVPAGVPVIVYVYRYGGNTHDCYVTYNVMYHTIPSP